VDMEVPKESCRGDKFPAISLLIPWGNPNRRYSCGFRNRKFFSREKFPATFPKAGNCMNCRI